MERFIPLAEVVDDEILVNDYENALDFDKVAVGEQVFYFNRFARVEYLPIASITRAYRSVGGINPNQCCNTAFDVFTLVVKAKEVAAESRIPYESQLEEILQVLAERNPNIAFEAE